jgi:hypothetical protein
MVFAEWSINQDRRKAPDVKGTESLTCAREGIRTPNLLIRSFPSRLPKRISKVLVLRSFVSFERESAPVRPPYRLDLRPLNS